MASLLLILSYILLGSYALIVQVVCMREILVVFYGNELCLGVVFACWLLGIAIGAGVIARHIDRIHQKFLLYLILFLSLCFLFPLQIACIRSLRSLLHVPPGELISPFKLLIGSLSTITPFSFFIGAIFPVGCSLVSGINGQSSSSTSQPIGRMYIAEAIGSILGGVTFTFLLVTRYHAFQIAALMGCIVFLVTGIFSGAYKSKLKFALLMGLVSLVGGLLYGYAFFSSPADAIHKLTLNKRWESMHHKIDFVKSVDSKYQNLSLGLQAGQYALFTNGQYASIFPDKYGAAVTAHFYLTEHPAPKHVLLIGGGAEGLIGEMLKHPIEKLDYVELDPQLLDLLSDYLPADVKQALHDPRVAVIYTDGRYYVKQTQNRYDVVILNLPDPTTAMLNRFYTLEFFQEVQHILNPGGIVITKISASFNLQEDAANYTGSLYKTLRAVFPYVLVTPGTANIYFAASQPGVLTFDTIILSQRYLARGITSDYFSEYLYDTLLQPEQIAFVASTFQQRFARFRLNTDFQPITYFYSLLLWTRFSEITPERQAVSLTGKILHLLSHLPAWYFFAPILAFILIRLCYLWLANVPLAKRIKFNCLWTIGATGFAGMALELILIFAFQNIYGYIYQKAGLIVAVFMVGLAAGGYGTHAMLRRHGDSRSLSRLQESKLMAYLLYFEIVIVIFAAVLPVSIRFLSAPRFLHTPTLVELGFMLFVGVAGLLTGMVFPLASAIYLNTQRELGKTAGLIDSADHIGACCGSLLVGVLLVTLLGVTTSCDLISMINLSSVVFLLANYLRRSS